MKKIIAMVMVLVFAASVMAFAAEKKVPATIVIASPVTTTAKTGKAITAKVIKVKHHKGKKAVVKPAKTPIPEVK